jgi:hypothetical protein
VAYLSPSTVHRILKSANFVVSFLHEYSRYVVQLDIASGMDAITVNTAAQATIATPPAGAGGEPLAKPVVRSDHGSGYLS